MTVETDDAYRAIGRFTYEFSRLILYLRWHVAQMTLAPVPRLAREPKAFEALWLQTGEMTAYPLANAFFGIAETVGDYSPEEAKMARWLHNQLKPLIETRNDFLHGEWEIGWGQSASDGTFTILPPSVSKTRPARRGEKNITMTHAPSELDAISDDVSRLRRTIADWGSLVAGNSVFVPFRTPNAEVARPRDVYVMRDEKVMREGPRAREAPLAPWD